METNCFYADENESGFRRAITIDGENSRGCACPRDEHIDEYIKKISAKSMNSIDSVLPLLSSFYLKEKLYLSGDEISSIKKDFDFDNGNLIEEKENEKEENKKYLHRERKSYSKVTRTFYLGDVSEDEIDASFKNGVLVVSAPKKKEIETKKTISIKDHE